MRSSPLIEYSSTVLLLCLWLGAITTVFSSLVGLFQQDIKKVIAYSTMSQMAREQYRKFFYMFRHQTIYVKFIFKGMPLLINNSQITKALNYYKRKTVKIYCNYISINLFNSFSNLRLLYINIKNNTYFIKGEKWKIIIISKLVGISEAIRLILINLWSIKPKIKLSIKASWFKSIILFFNTVFGLFLKGSIFKRHCPLSNLNVIIDTTLLDSNENRKINQFKGLASTNNNEQGGSNPLKTRENLDFYEWLAGLIDGDGYFNLSKKGIARFNLVMDIRDKAAVTYIQQKLGGSIYKISNAKALKYQLTSKNNLINLINNVNGLIRNPTRLTQMNKLCIKYGITLIYPKPLTFNNGWLSGFIDSDGSVYVNVKSGQIFISASQKNMYLLEPLINIYGGRVDAIGAKIEAFKYIIYRKSELFNLIDKYFIKYPLRSAKASRVNLIKDFYNFRLYQNSEDLNKLNLWVKWKEKWDKYEG